MVPEPAQPESDEEANARIVRELLERAINEHDLATADRLLEPTGELHAPLGGLSPGAEGVKDVFRRLHSGFPDMRVTIEDTITKEDSVVVRWSSEQTHTGMYRGLPPTGKRVRMTAIEWFRVEDGRIQETFLELDALTAARQMGVEFPQRPASPRTIARMLRSLFRFARLALRDSLRRR